jgi:hypothetical protein
MLDPVCRSGAYLTQKTSALVLEIKYKAMPMQPSLGYDLCFATILSALKIARFPAATAVPSRLSLHSSAKNLSRKNPRAVYLYILRMHEPGRFRDAVGSD